MAVNVGEMVSDVSVEPEAQSAGPGETPDWKETERFRETRARAACDRMRTAAEGYND
jgi:hypothetical protein